MIRRPPTSTLCPYTTRFRSIVATLDEPALRLERVEVFLGEAAADVVERLACGVEADDQPLIHRDRKSTRLNSSHANISYAVFCLKRNRPRSSRRRRRAHCRA